MRFGGQTADLTGVVREDNFVYDLVLIATRGSRIDTARVVMR